MNPEEQLRLKDEIKGTLLQYPFSNLSFMFYEIFSINVPEDILDSGYKEANTSQSIMEFYFNLWVKNVKITKENLFFKCKICYRWASFKFFGFKDTCFRCIPKTKARKQDSFQEVLE